MSAMIMIGIRWRRCRPWAPLLPPPVTGNSLSLAAYSTNDRLTRNKTTYECR